MPRKKSVRAAQLARMPHVFMGPEEAEATALREFATSRPLVLDLGCGRGDTTVALAAGDPNRHYLGVDLKPARLHRGAEAVQHRGLGNVAFVALCILQLGSILPERVCDEGFLFFPDPFLKNRAAKHRLTSPAYLGAYRKLMRKGARLHLRTDSRPLFDYSLRTLKREGCLVCETALNLPPDSDGGATHQIQSHYELRFRLEGRAIYYLSFQVH